MTRPIKLRGGRFAGQDTPSRRRKQAMERMGQSYAEEGAAQSDYDDPAETADVGREYDMLQKATRRHKVRYPKPDRPK